MTDLTTIATSSKNKRPPLECWHPTDIVAFDVHIDSDGIWYHEGRPIARKALVALLSHCLWGEYDDKGVLQYYFKTPTHLYQISVADAPFVITQVDKIDGVIVFTTQLGDTVLLDNEHIPYFASFELAGQNELRAYVPMRYHLSAKIARSAFYHLVSLGTLSTDQHQTTLSLTSGGVCYTISAAG